MKKKLNTILAAVVLVGLSACGGDDNYDSRYGIDPRYQGFANACGQNIPSNAPYMQTVRGIDSEANATIELLIYGDGSGQVGAVGELYIPNLSVLGAGVSGSFRGCISTQGMNGFMERDGTYDELRVQLSGSGATLQPEGYAYPYVPVVQNQYISGRFILQLSGSNLPITLNFHKR